MLLVTIHMEKCGNAIKKTNKQTKKPPWVRQNSYKICIITAQKSILTLKVITVN